ncbi:alpha-L-rhamnosidase [Agromyces rhizosphaerae]|uniref:alpha-L-rhamnosidase n=1 Tax=Agromyces rhizosphaerae TaxID=88374 RepID=A0A9W6CXA0_9MICO|nr:alpha-L-rhamnosidase [Agromyces rhizosphaerae]GLI27009.1 alpha-L-rhamnosidase [Agromyces rhizosphaerae]
MSDPRTVRVDAGAPRGSDIVASARPRLSWATETDAPGWLQSAAELELRRGDDVETSSVAGRDSVDVPWPFAPLAPREHVELRVRTTGADGATSPWSEPRGIRAGFLADGEWDAAPIAHAAPDGPAQPVLLRTEFALDAGVAAATLYATALGAYQVAINGTDVDEQVLKPGWTPYRERLIHETTDVTGLLRDGANAIGVRLAGAWATEEYGFRDHARRVYGEQPAFAALLVVEYDDGSELRVRTGPGAWSSHPSPVTASGIYAGESHDARRELPGWSEPGFDASAWTPAAPGPELVVPEARTSPFVRRIEELPVAEVITTPSGATVLDFGQNLVGRLRITVRGAAGDTVMLRHAEVLEHGELGVRPLRAAEATDHYTLAGAGEETWEPEFTFHGFRYAEVSGWPGEFDPADVTAVVIHSDMERTGWFDTSHDLVRQLHENVVWGLRGNFLYLPTDCPQRDERLGWTGDIEVFAPTASFLYDVRGFLDSWLVDLAIEQVDGVVPFVVPNVLDADPTPAAAWGDAATVVPWVLAERFGDEEVLARQYPSMVAWTEAILAIAGDRRLWEGRFQFGDWLDPDAPPENPFKAKTDTDIVASAYLFRSVDLVARAAERLGHAADAERFGRLREEVREAFLAEYVTPSGRMVSDAQTGYAVAIEFGIAHDAQRDALGARLAELSRRGGYLIGTGFVGTPIIADALSSTGHVDTARRLLTATGNPSWLYPVTMGATTIWERWDSMLPDGSINPGEMTSFNHYALGAIADWMHRVLAGLAPAADGYRALRIAPTPLEGFDHASAEHLTPYGTARVAWRREGDDVAIEATVPPNTTATVHLPGAHDEVEIGSGVHAWRVPAPASPPSPGVVSLESPLADIVDDPEAYAALAGALDGGEPGSSAPMLRSIAWVPGRDLGEAIRMRTTAVQFDAVAAALGELNRERGLAG